MKHNVTFEEVGKVFQIVVKIENAVAEYRDATIKADELENQFDAEFKKYNYTFFNAPASLNDLFDAKCSAKDDEDKKMKAIRNYVKKFIEMAGLNDGYREYWEDEIISFAVRPYHHKIERVVFDVKLAAKNLAKYINF